MESVLLTGKESDKEVCKNREHVFVYQKKKFIYWRHQTPDHYLTDSIYEFFFVNKKSFNKMPTPNFSQFIFSCLFQSF